MLHFALKGADSLPRDACLTLAFEVYIPFSRRSYLQGLDSLLKDPFCFQGLASLLEKLIKVLFPSLRHPLPLGGHDTSSSYPHL